MKHTVILDASALLAVLRREKGAEIILRLIEAGAMMTTINLSEVISKLYYYKVDKKQIELLIAGLSIAFIHVAEELAHIAASYYYAGKHYGLSLADKICLAAARRGNYTAVTTDTIWARLEMGIKIQVIR